MGRWSAAILRLILLLPLRRLVELILRTLIGPRY